MSRSRNNRRNNRNNIQPDNQVDNAPVDDGTKEVGNLGPEKAYAYIGAIEGAFDVGALGLGASGTISSRNSLVTAMTVTGISAAMQLSVALHEIYTVAREICCRPDGRTVESTSHPATEFSIYLSFRLISIGSEIVGMALVAADIAADTTTLKTTVGIMALAVGHFAGRALSGTKHKSSGAVLTVDPDELDELEQGFGPGPDDHPPVEAQAVPLVAMARAAQQPPAGRAAGQQREMEEVPLVSDARDVQPAGVAAAVSIPASPSQQRRPNHFFQAPPQQPSAPQSAAPQPPSASQGPAVKAASAAHKRAKKGQGHRNTLLAPPPAAPAPVTALAQAEPANTSASQPRNI